VTTAVDRAHAGAAVEAARATPGALSVEVDHHMHLGDAGQTPAVGEGTTQVQGVAPAVLSDDTYRGQQWALDTLQAETAWSLHRATGQVVAVLDTGVDATHPDLAGRVLPGNDFVAAGGDGRTDPQGHGTHVAGIIAAVAGDHRGIAGLADGADILPVRVLDATGSGWASDAANGIVWAVDHGAGVLNLSLTGADDATLAAAVSYAQSRNVVVVAAAGNDRNSGDPAEYPAAYPGVAAVAATDATMASAGFSETGADVKLAAPGVAILSTYPVALGSFASMSGTSMAAPYVAAAAALVRAAAPQLNATAVLEDLYRTADDLGQPGRDDEFGAGLVDPVAALRSLPGPGQPVGSMPSGAAPRVGSWFYLNDQNSGTANIVLAYGDPGDQVLVANTDGSGGDKLLIRRGNTYYVRNSLTTGPGDYSFVYGNPTDTVLVGDWNGDGKDTLAVRRGNTYYIKNSLSTGTADAVINYGNPTDTVLVGDWNGDGTDTLAVRRGGTYYLKNALTTGVADVVFAYGDPGDTVLAGNWNGHSTGLAVRRGNTYYLKNALTTGVADVVFAYGDPGDTVLVGDWNGDGTDSLGVRRVG
jgi:type VII secretion-associated serine protease mycosin